MTPYLEIGGEYHEIRPGLWRIELPLPFSLGTINVYLVALAEGWMLVDTGMRTEPCEKALEAALEGIGVAFPQIRHVLLTHVHPDHMGLVPWVLERSGARLGVHPDELALLETVLDSGRQNRWLREILKAAGSPPELLIEMEVALAAVQRNFHPLSPDVLLGAGQSIETTFGPLEVLVMPGHSAGHVCLYHAGERLLLGGDLILEHISPNIGWSPGHDALGAYLDSLERLATLDVERILPSHGAPFSGHREWVARTRAHHEQRCGHLLAAIAESPGKSAHELIPALWDRKLSPFHYRFALFELRGHLEYLLARKHVAMEIRSGVEHWLPV